ncbi:DUF2267 domain-containing protein [Rubrobacter aplysinae]|uniref:DUF2267 domain-containing protein n=1 Tax=Rubrobacter aplysinae TaxID=909625 RepID=UPI00064C1881|nr:DUF2267 domain-containing protein [Rubrobacter aplysinae]
MQYEEFIESVGERAGIGYLEAESATGTVLNTLAGFLVDSEGLDLSEQLPKGVAEHLRQRPPERSEFFSVEDFVQQVGEDEGIGPDKAETRSRAVLVVLQQAVSGGEMDDVRRQFPSEFDRLFEG